MPESLGFGVIRLDFAWFWELGLMALSWVLAYRGRFLRKDRRTVLRGGLEFLALMAALALCNLGARLLGGTAGMGIFMPLWSTVRGVVPAVYVALCSPYRRSTNTVMWCSMFAAVLGVSAIGGQFSMLLGEFGAKGTPEAIARSAAALLLPALALYLHAFNFDDYERVPPGGITLILVGDFSVIALTVIESLWAGADYRVTVTLAVAYICIFTMVVFAIYAMYAMCREQAKVLTLQAERQRAQAEREMARLSEAALADLRAIRHDLKNHFAFMRILLDEGRYAELGDYFQSVSQNLPAPLSSISCGNKTVDIILNMEFSKAKKLEVPVEHKLAVPPELPFPEDDLCAVLTNLIDNAVEECVKLKEQGQQTGVWVEISRRGGYLYIVCRNTTGLQRLDRRESGLRTTKGDERIHGYGTRIVAKTAEKYNGKAEYTLKDGQFVASVILDMSAPGEETSA